VGVTRGTPEYSSEAAGASSDTGGDLDGDVGDASVPVVSLVSAVSAGTVDSARARSLARHAAGLWDAHRTLAQPPRPLDSRNSNA